MASSMTGRALGVALSVTRRAARLHGAGRAGHHRGSAARPGQCGRMADVRPRLPQSALQPARADHARQRQAAAAGLGVLDRRPVRRPRGDAALPGRRALHLGRLLARVRDRRQDRQPALVVRARISGRPRGQALLRPGQPRRRAEGRPGLRQHARCQALRAQPQGRLGGLAADDRRLEGSDHRDRRAARGQGRGDRRHRRRRIRRARLHQGLRRQDRRAALADLHDPGPRRARQRHLAGRHLAARRRRHLAAGRLRRRDRYPVLGHRQPRPLELGPAQGRQSLELIAARPRSRHRQDQVGLSVHAERRLGLRRQQRHDPARHDDRRPAGQGGGAVEPQRLLLRARPDQRRVRLRRADGRGHQLDQGPRPEDRAARGRREQAPDRAAAQRSSRSCPASKAAPTGSRWPTIRTSATSTSRPTTGPWR